VLFDAAVDRVLALFDIDQPTAVSFVNERHKRMCGEAEFRLAETSLGSTVAGQYDYNLPDTVENLAYLMVGADTVPYVRAGELEMVGLRNGTSKVENAPGAISFYADATGIEKVRIYPTPSVSGTAMIGLSVLIPADLAYGQGAIFLPPEHLHSYILDGAIADGYEQIESRWDLGTPHDQRFEAGIEKLRRYKNSRLGRGPTQIKRGW
jgi:hypothetical protein